MSDPAITAEAAAEGGRVLALRVLEQAILDATCAPIPRGRARSQCRAVEDEQREAMRFLTETDGQWAAARRAWCDLAGVSPEYLKRRLLNDKKIPRLQSLGAKDWCLGNQMPQGSGRS